MGEPRITSFLGFVFGWNRQWAEWVSQNRKGVTGAASRATPMHAMLFSYVLDTREVYLYMKSTGISVPGTVTLGTYDRSGMQLQVETYFT